MTFQIRTATAADADSIGRLAKEFQKYLGSQGSTAEYSWDGATYLRDGFGEDPAFAGVVAEVDGVVVGYALHHFGYDTDHGERYLYLIDLFVSAACRGRGIGRELMERCMTRGRARGATLIAWSVLTSNAAAVRFYEGMGARYVEGQHTMWRPIPTGA